jgi:transposase
LADYDAVRAAVTLPWSNGPAEGQINRLKMLKRHVWTPPALQEESG